MTEPDKGSRAGGLLRLVALVTGVAIIAVVAVYLAKGDGDSASGGCAGSVTEVRGIIGSEKEQYFRDPRVVERLRCLGLRVVIDSRGSLDMVDPLRRPGNGYGFAFPGSRVTARKIMADQAVQHELPALDQYEVFSSPMVVATLTETVGVLRDHGSARTVDGQTVVDLAAVVEMARAGTTWNSIKDNPTAADQTQVLLNSTDPDASNSGFLLLAAAAWSANGNRAQIGSAALPEVANRVCQVFAAQGGSKPVKSQDLFDQYAGQNPKTRMAYVYESQVLSAKVLPEGHAVMYPNPGIASVHTVIALTADGQRVGQSLREDDELAGLIAEHGFRPQGRPARAGAADPAVTAAESPSFDEMSALTDLLVAKRNSGKRCDQ
ncbi:hypothetical protein ACOBQX_00880 [Actinokineospora sp. G85]|uniref:hypothetical protein n=1 Tax=Actinokineospora sp. G85 TaxID=3406626 RepID=UPI003C7150CD